MQFGDLLQSAKYQNHHFVCCLDFSCSDIVDQYISVYVVIFVFKRLFHCNGGALTAMTKICICLSCTEGSEVDILDVSIQNMSIHGKFVFNTFLVTLFSGVLFFTIHNFLNFIVRYIAFNIEDFLDSH